MPTDDRLRPEQEATPETEEGSNFPGDLPEKTEDTGESIGAGMRRLERESGERGTPAETTPPETRQGARE